MLGILAGVITLVVICGIAIANIQPRQYGEPLNWTSKEKNVIPKEETISWFEYMDLMDKKNEENNPTRVLR